VTKRDALRLLNLFVGLTNLYMWNINGLPFNFVMGCLNIGVFVFGKK
tara:strand:+ start:1881 stop:2021 length:141 start_codon:yes stop_codon:yes gene_type:complete